MAGFHEVCQRFAVFEGIVHRDAEGMLGQNGVDSVIESGLELGEERNGVLFGVLPSRADQRELVPPTCGVSKLVQLNHS